MPHDTPLIATIVVGLCLAFVFGAIAQRLRVSPLVGYLLAGVALGPYTPGFVADQTLASELAEIGVILLMFGVGLHFSLKDLWSVRLIAVPGAIVQIAVATMFGVGLGYWLGWPIGAGITFGLALSVASTVVLLRALQERRIINTERGRIAVGWLIVEDLVMVLTLVMLPALVPILNGSLQDAPSTFEMSQIAATLGTTIAKVAAFVVVMLVIGRRVIPWILHYVAHSGSRELFRLAVLSIALGCAYGAAQLFDVSFALGAFFAGMILSESALSQQAASETLPLRDAFAVLFFISVGMLFDPAILVRDPLLVLATVAIIVIAKSVAALAIVQLFGRPLGTAATIAVSLAQIGEFSFILAGLGVSLGLMPPLGRELVLAGAIISIVLNPLLFMMLDRLRPWLDQRDGAKAVADAVAADKAMEASAEAAAVSEMEVTTQQGHTVLVGYGSIGYWIGEALSSAGVPLFVIEEKDAIVARLKARGIEAVAASAPSALVAANLRHARALLVAVPEAFEAGQIVAQARAANSGLFIVAHAHSDAEAAYLSNYGASVVVQGAREIAATMVAQLPPPAVQERQTS